LLKELGVSAGDLLKNKKLLTKVLLYHVASGRLPAAGVLTSDRIRMLRGGHLSQSGGVLTDANGRTSTIIAPDAAFADNGVIHVIDRVVLPNLK
jgi:transforming growth factor-beta-induced protein